MNTFRPTRIVALVLVTLTAVGFVYLHFSLGSDKVSVPSGARAGQLKLHPCHYGTENGSYRADCGTLVVRENRHDPHSRLIEIHTRDARSAVCGRHRREGAFALVPAADSASYLGRRRSARDWSTFTA